MHPNLKEYVVGESLIRLPKVKQRTGLSRSSIYLRASLGTFPRPVPLGRRAVAWVSSEIDKWIQKQIELGRGEP